MAGHSKWANIKHKKEKADKQKGKLFSKLAKEIISAVKVGGPDPHANPRLRIAINKAKIANFPTDNIERNIKKGSSSSENYETVIYELYGFGGVGLIVEGMTDNKNRMATDIRIATNKRGGTIATPGSVMFNFDKKGVIQLTKNSRNEEFIIECALEAGAEDVDFAEEGVMVVTDPSFLYSVKEKMDQKGFNTDEANIEMIPKVLITCDEETKKSNQALIDWLEDLDDVNVVYHNMEM